MHYLFTPAALATKMATTVLQYSSVLIGLASRELDLLLKHSQHVLDASGPIQHPGWKTATCSFLGVAFENLLVLIVVEYLCPQKKVEWAGFQKF